MPAKSKSQQRLFGMVTAYKEDKLKLDDLPKSLAKKIKGIADGEKKKTGDKRKKTKGITKKAASEYASTKHKRLPEKVKESRIFKFEDYLNENNEEYMKPLEGGEAEDLTIEEVAKMHNVPVKYIEMIMPQAIEIEMEHTDDPEVAARIALDHLVESPLYYDEKIGLPEMEEELEELEEDEIEEVIDDRMDKKIKKFDDFDDENESEDENESDNDN